MSELSQAVVHNRLLRALVPDDYALIGTHLQPITTVLHQVLIPSNSPTEQLFFLEAGFASITFEGQAKPDVGMIGPEGLVGIAALLDDDSTPYETFVQAPGSVLAIEADVLRKACDQSRSLRTLLMRYVHTVLIQTSQTAFVNATYDVEARLVRWLLMCQDRMGGTELALTHEFLSMMLGVQRTSVTLSLQTLEGTGLIRARRGRIEIRDREQMIVAADKSYGVPEAAYDRLIGR